MTRVTVSGDGLVLGDRPQRLLSGEVHPWRLDRSDWPAVLDAIQDLGFDTISTYISWARHETAPGTYDFTGAYDVDAFLRMVQDRGMYAVVRVGPNTAA